MASTVPAQKEDRIVFTSGPKGYSVRDIIDAAYFRGELDPFWNEVLLRAEADRLAHETDAELDEAALEEASIAFRYQYDLITAEETEQWLEIRGLTLSDFSEYFAREQWVKAFGGKAEPDLVPFAQASARQRELLAEELTLSGELDRMATRLAWRVAARASAETDEIEEALVGAERARFVQRSGVEGEALAGWLRGLGQNELWLEENLAMEVIYRERCTKILTKEARDREISALRLPMTRLEMEIIELESRDAANEAFLCVRDDGMSMEEVAQEGRYPYRRTDLVLEEIPVEMQQKFLSLSPGNVLEPTPREDGYVLSRLLGKAEPKPDDPDVRARIEQRIMDRHFADLTSGRIQWQILFAPSEE